MGGALAIEDKMTAKWDVERVLRGEVGVEPTEASLHDGWWAAAKATREQLAIRKLAWERQLCTEKVRRVYYLSMEFLIGRSLGNALDALELAPAAREDLRKYSLQLEDVLGEELDPGLGNGGLGRLAACFLDSLATLGIPSMGYGIRYEHGMFAQAIRDGMQVEYPDPWLSEGNPWEFPRPEIDYRVSFGGRVEHDATGKSHWVAAGEVRAQAFDLIIPGQTGNAVSSLRLWRAAAPDRIDLYAFNSGDYARAAIVKNEYENISWVLYPNDSTPAGRELRLRQEYFFVSASLQDILARHQAEHGDFDSLADYVAIHLNDTHPAIAIPELMRLLCDEHELPWQRAWDICSRVFSYTNHTLMPEALETWPVDLMQRVLPRHLDLIYRINQQLLDHAADVRPGDLDFLARLSLIDEEGERRVRMAHLCIAGSHKINGVSALHSNLLVQTIFADFAVLWPERFTNVTNGITPRRWLQQANRGLSSLLDDYLGQQWRRNLDAVAGLRALADDQAVQTRFAAIKLANKQRLAAWLEQELDVLVNADSLFDVQVKRIHEYKRQLLNLMHVIARYQSICAHPDGDWVPRTVLFAGKAASSYAMAKDIIRLIHDVARVINSDPRTEGRLQLLFVPNYGVSVAELIMPAADLSEQISTAGTEASGTGNMKLALNGALTIGTEDGANIEIAEQVGADHIFNFGLRAPEVAALRREGYDPMQLYAADTAVREVLDDIASGRFSPEEPERHRGIVNALLWGGDHYLLLADFQSYLAAQRRVDERYRDVRQWRRSALLNVAGMGVFSSDRTIRDYAERIWRVPARH